MSVSELDRFARNLNSNWSLRADAEKAEKLGNQKKTPLERMTEFAFGRGYDFTLNEAKEWAMEKAEELDLPISSSDLERLDGFPYAGGILGIITGDF